MKRSAVPRRLFTFFIVLFAGIGGVLYGYDIGVISGALLFMKKDISLSATELSLIVAAVLGGGSIATLISGPLADFFGRKKMISIAAVFVIVGTVTLVGSHEFSSVLTGRLIQGIGIGIITIVIPLYLSETAPSQLRGRSVATFQLFLTGGILLAYVIDILFAHSGDWRGMFLCVLAPAGLLFIGSFFLTESPSWLFAKGRKDQAYQALLKTRTVNASQLELQEMTKLKMEVEELDPTARRKWKWRHYYLLPLIIALAVACLNQLTGINIFLQFSSVILKEAGLASNIISMLGSVGVGLMNFIMTIIALLLVDKLGRKPLLIIGTAGVVIALFFTGACDLFLQSGALKGYLVMGGLIGFILFFAIGPGVVVWLAISELLPMPIRGRGMALALFLNSMASTILAAVYLDLVSWIGYGGAFWMCGIFTVIYFIIATFILPETKGKTLEEIELYFRKKGKKA